MSDRRVLLVVVSLLVLSIGSGSIFAYLSASDISNNNFTMGENVSEIVEDWDKPSDIVAGETYTKSVSVKNTGSVDCYIRVFAEMETPEMSEAVSIADLNIDDWTSKQLDGYYYYKKVLKPGETTSPLFTTLESSSDLDDFKMIVYEESMQAEGFNGAQEAFR